MEPAQPGHRVKRILISGASGLVGSAVSRHLAGCGYAVQRLVRLGASLAEGDILWDPNSAMADVQAMEGFDAVINLNGASIAGKRWTSARKAFLRASRIGVTRLLVDCLGKLEKKPSVFLSVSGAGFYGDRGDEVLTEESEVGADFLAFLARDWEAEARRAETAGIRTAMLRCGMILSRDGGALGQIARPFRMGVGGKLGSGKQWMPWIAIEDVVEIVNRAIENSLLRGPLNVVAPYPVRNEDFTRALARVLHRPSLFPAPALALRMLLGEMADGLLLASQRAIPKKLTEAGYPFRFPEIETALRHALGGEK
ncbi:MAG TPA: TIGR01777 family oxidoreductase [Candidatus Acidoferrum sp.]|nr:TIGR01777 family oxidoreductase [Candidatus Acidoferrum sp.]